MGGRECLHQAFPGEQELATEVTGDEHFRRREQSQQSQRQAAAGCRLANAAFGVRQETLRWTCRQKLDLPLHVNFEFILWARNREPMKSFRTGRAKEKAGEVSISHGSRGSFPRRSRCRTEYGRAHATREGRLPPEKARPVQSSNDIKHRKWTIYFLIDNAIKLCSEKSLTRESQHN